MKREQDIGLRGRVCRIIEVGTRDSAANTNKIEI